jgi:hypothetical protein
MAGAEAFRAAVSRRHHNGPNRRRSRCRRGLRPVCRVRSIWDVHPMAVVALVWLVGRWPTTPGRLPPMRPGQVLNRQIHRRCEFAAAKRLARRDAAVTQKVLGGSTLGLAPFFWNRDDRDASIRGKRRKIGSRASLSRADKTATYPSGGRDSRESRFRIEVMARRRIELP